MWWRRRCCAPSLRLLRCKLSERQAGRGGGAGPRARLLLMLGWHGRCSSRPSAWRISHAGQREQLRRPSGSLAGEDRSERPAAHFARSRRAEPKTPLECLRWKATSLSKTALSSPLCDGAKGLALSNVAQSNCQTSGFVACARADQQLRPRRQHRHGHAWDRQRTAALGDPGRVHRAGLGGACLARARARRDAPVVLHA